MKKIIFLLLVAFLASCNSSNQEVKTEENSSAQINYQKVLDAVDKEISKSEDFNSCVISSVTTCESDTARGMAMQSQNFEICDKLSETSSADSCKLGVILAKEPKVIEDCDSLSENHMKFVCQTNIINIKANPAKDVNMCNEIMNLTTETEENKIIAKDNCMIGIFMAEDTTDATKCELLNNEDNKEFCKNMMSR